MEAQTAKYSDVFAKNTAEKFPIRTGFEAVASVFICGALGHVRFVPIADIGSLFDHLVGALL